MNYKNPFKKSAIALAVSSATILAGSFGSLAHAQEENIVEPNLEEVVVTGSRIRNANLEGFAPVETLGRQKLLSSGSVDVGDLLGSLPGFSGSPIGTTTNNGGSGAVQVDLRGLGEVRTLVLIDGVRTIEGNDFQTIPTAMIDRIEVLKEGAAAVYGADAVSGVINIITRKDIEGFEVDAQYSQSLEAGEDDVATISFATGKTFDRGRAQFIAEYSEQGGAFQGDYGYEFFQDSFFVFDANGSADTFRSRGTGQDAILSSRQDPDNFSAITLGSSRVPGGYARLAAPTTINGQAFAAGDILTRDLTTGQFREFRGGLFDVPNDTYNYAPVNYIQTPYEKLNLFASFDYELTDDITFTSKIRYNDRTSQQFLAPLPYSGGTTDPSFADIVPGVAVSGQSFFNPFGVDLDQARRRVVEIDRTFDQDVSQTQVILGLDGNFGNDIRWNAGVSYGKRDRTDIDRGQFLGSAIAQGLGPSFQDTDGTIRCGTPGNVIQGCVPIDLFGGPGTITQEQLDFVSVDLVDEFESETTIFSAGIDGSQSLLGLDIGWAAGVEYRDEEASFTPDLLKQQDAVTGSTGLGTVGDFDVKSVYGEAGTSLFDNGSQALDVNIGVRHDDFSNFGSNTTAQYKLKFQLTEGLVLRANYAEVFRAPTIGELFAGLSDNFPTANDPCGDRFTGGFTPIGCPAGSPIVQADTQLPGLSGGNSQLDPEQGDNTIIGVVFQPTFVDGLSLTLDYWEIELEDAINAVTAEGVLNFCHRDGLLCDNITRRSDGSISSILSAAQNIATESAKGFDFTVDYKWDIESIGAAMALNLQYTRLTERNFQADPTSDVLELEGTFNQDFQDNYLEDKAVLEVRGGIGKFGITYTLEYNGDAEYDARFTGDTLAIDKQIYHDISVAYQVNDSISVTGGFRNLTDEEPPFFDSGFNASTDPSTYRVDGRGVFARVSAKF